MRPILRALPFVSAVAVGGFSATVAIVATASAAYVQAPFRVQARFSTPASYRAHPGVTRAVTYDPASVPVSSRIQVTESANEWGGMSVKLDLGGLRPHTGYQAYVNVGRCTASPTGAGRHLLNSPSSGNYPENEFSFNIKTNGTGSASALTQKYWGIGQKQHANSVVILRSGARHLAACVTVPFRRLNPGW